MYELRQRVRYSELDEQGQCSLLAMMNYLQDCSTFHSEDVGLGMELMAQRRRAWLLSAWTIELERLPKLGEELTVGTSPHAFKGLIARRNYWVRAGEEYLLRADSQWFCVNLDTMHPQRIETDLVEAYGVFEDYLGLKDEGRKIVTGEMLAPLRPVEVLPHHIDTNHHMNNAQYVAIAAQRLLEYDASLTPWPGRIRAEYRRAAVLGDKMLVQLCRNDAGYVIHYTNEDGETFANVEFRKNTDTTD